MGMSFTEDQTKAINSSGTNIIVSAGAGSGKTAVLSERVLHFVRDENYKLNEFLILTFTKLAAGEMKERIRKKLEDNNLEEAKNVDVSDICNFDSYSFGLLRKYHFMLGLSENVSIIEPDIVKLKKMEILDDMMNKKYGENDELFNSFVSKFCVKDDENVRKMILKVEEKASQSDDTEAFFSSFSKKYTGQKYLDFIIDELNAIISEEKKKLEELVNALPDCSYLSKDKSALLKTDVNKILKGALRGSYDEFIDCVVKTKLPSNSVTSRNKLLSEDVIDDFKKLTAYKRDLQKLFTKYPDSMESVRNTITENEKYIPLILDMAREINQKQMRYKYEKQVFEFNDIAKMVLKLIRENQDIRDSIKYHLKMIMIDEYQDTSTIQEAFIKEIENNNVYMVGDIKQSIYRFRKAESSIFRNKYNAYKLKDGGMAIDLNKNFRSRKEVLEDINLIFSNIMSEDIGGADYKKDHIIEYGNKDYLAAGEVSHSCHSEVISYFDSENSPEKKMTADARADAEINIIAQDIISKMNSSYQVYQYSGNGSFTRPCRLSDFCILIDRGSSFNDYSRIFSSYHIPLFVEQDVDINSDIVVLTLKSVIKMIICIKNRDYESSDFLHSYLSLARSFIYQYDDEKIYLIKKDKKMYEDRICEDFRNIYYKYSSLSSYQIIENAVFDLDILHKLVTLGNIEIHQLYLNQFLEKFASMSELGYSMDEFILYLDKINEMGLKFTISSQGSDKDSVRIMNIHKSKGLEFPIVYFTGFSKEFNESDAGAKFTLSDKYGPVFDSEFSDKGYVTKLLNERYEKKEDLSEKIRLFYVALTRAREKMIFVIPRDINNKPLEKASSFMDLFTPFKDIEIFEKREVDMASFEKKELTLLSKETEDEKLIVKDLNIVSKEITSRKASKDLKLGTSYKTLGFGTDLHFMMEICDFKKPDISFIKNTKIRTIITNFLASPLMKDVSKAKIYKEYEFIDGETSGIIDLMMVYDDHIDIIDYKTKNIDEEEYDRQLKTYSSYIKKRFSSETRCYLYSLMEGKVREVK